METPVKATGYKDIYQEVTETVIKLLEEGTVIWQSSWHDRGWPKNHLTQLHYRGWNLFFLNFHSERKGYPTAQYLTFKQANQLGGTIKKGEKGVKIIYWATIKPKDDEHAPTSNDEQQKSKLVPKTYTVFNIAQTDGIEFPTVAPIIKSETEKIATCEDVVERMPNPPKMRFDGDCAFYQPIKDTVVVPSIEKSIGAEEYYSTLFHELAHSTGHSTRLNRKELMETDGFGKINYAKEELTAEMTAAYLSAVTGIGQPTIENSAAYIENWLSVLKNDKTLIIKAAAQAQKAADYILNEKVVCD
jgi:antirestriction protein ArdC